MEKRMAIPVTLVSINNDAIKNEQLLEPGAFIINKDGSISLARTRDSPDSVSNSISCRGNNVLPTSFLNWYLNHLYLDKGEEGVTCF